MPRRHNPLRYKAHMFSKSATNRNYFSHINACTGKIVSTTIVFARMSEHLPLGISKAIQYSVV